MFLKCFLTTLIISTFASEWRDPVEVPSLVVSRNATNPLRIGDVLELTCTSKQGFESYTNLQWTMAQGNFQFFLQPHGKSPLIQRIKVTSDLHGAEFFCSGPYSEMDEVTLKYTAYTVRSNRVKLEVEGGTNIVIPDKPGRIEMSSVLANTSHHVNDSVSFICNVQDLHSTVVDVFIAKENIEIQLITSYQPWRAYWLRTTAAEDGARMYCIATTLEEDQRTLYAIVSNRVPIQIIKQ